VHVFISVDFSRVSRSGKFYLCGAFWHLQNFSAVFFLFVVLFVIHFFCGAGNPMQPNARGLESLAAAVGRHGHGSSLSVKQAAETVLNPLLLVSRTTIQPLYAAACNTFQAFLAPKV